MEAQDGVRRCSLCGGEGECADEAQAMLLRERVLAALRVWRKVKVDALMPLEDLAEAVCIKTSMLEPLLRDLEIDGYVGCAPLPGSGPVRVVYLTERGQCPLV